MHQGGWVQWVLSTDIAHNYWPMVIRKIKLTFGHFIIVLKFSSDNASLIVWSAVDHAHPLYFPLTLPPTHTPGVFSKLLLN